MTSVKELKNAINEYKNKNCPKMSGMKKEQLMAIAQNLKVGPFLGARDPHEEIQFPKKELTYKQKQKKEEKDKKRNEEKMTKYKTFEEEENQYYQQLAELQQKIVSSIGLEREKLIAEQNELVKKGNKFLTQKKLLKMKHNETTRTKTPPKMEKKVHKKEVKNEPSKPKGLNATLKEPKGSFNEPPKGNAKREKELEALEKELINIENNKSLSNQEKVKKRIEIMNKLAKY